MIVNVNQLLQDFVDQGATDLYLTVGAPPSLRFADSIRPCALEPLDEEDVHGILQVLVSTDIIEEFNSMLEYNTAINWENKARFRINILRQQQHTAIVMRRIITDIPSLESLRLPKIYADLIIEKRGLILVVGPTGSGKSTSLAAMLEYRNQHGTGHIVTIEDPVEFLHQHHHCIITQRDVGIDTFSFSIGLKNALRQTPDVIVIGEIRDKETMDHAIVFAETGHLCLATLHANNANQAIERIINFFPEEKHRQILLNLSLNLKAILSQRLVRNNEGNRTAAIEIMLNQGLIRNLIHEGHIRELRECIEKSRDCGMQSFDQALIEMYGRGVITEETALAESDNPANLRLAITQRDMGKRIAPLRNAGAGIIPANVKPQF
ncbi:MAG: PilT/PilU family type 4a pilus ATPase [Pseudomonadota bacterium]|nr:PilT/PilU family type 4a pilus ATPase [Pseudomonadota bacterium]MDE3038375.1 PilT/PilU family type 4a pilus ATPase [Pseudomonadota bacterium]